MASSGTRYTHGTQTHRLTKTHTHKIQFFIRDEERKGGRRITTCVPEVQKDIGGVHEENCTAQRWKGRYTGTGVLVSGIPEETKYNWSMGNS